MEPATRAIGAAAASLVPSMGDDFACRTPLVVATAAVLEADRIITTDARWPAITVKVEVLGKDAQKLGLDVDVGSVDAVVVAPLARPTPGSPRP